MKPCLLLPFLCLCLNLPAQSRITGIITDQRGEGLPFVHIVLNGQKDRVFTAEINGEFSIPYGSDIKTLTFSYVGFETQDIALQGPPAKPLRVTLKEAAYQLQEAVVVAGENPAHRIIRQAVKNRDRNNPEKLDAWRYRSFAKVTLKLLPNWAEMELRRKTAESTRKSGKEGAAADTFELKDVHLFLMETLTDHAFQKPGRKREELLSHRTSGFKDPWFASLATQLQPFSFYRDELPFLEKRYLNPVSPGSTERYRFRLEDTFTEGPDSVFVISFQPRPGTAFAGLKGVLHIHSDGFAIQHLIAESAEKEQIKFHIDQKYSRAQGGQWFPEQLSLVLDAEKYPDPSVGTRMSSRTYIDSVRIRPEFPKGFFSPAETYFVAPDLVPLDSIAQVRPEPLSRTDSMSYVLWDSLGRKANLDGKMRTLEVITEGALPIGKIEWVFTDLIRFNNFEGFNPGLGLRTGRNLSKQFQLYGYGGYAFKAKQWKYAGSLTWFPSAAHRRTSLSVFYNNTLVEPATFDFPLRTQLVNRRYFAGRMDRQESMGAAFSARPLRSLSLRVGLERQRHEPLFEYRYLPPVGEPLSEFRFTEADVFLRYAHGATSLRFLGAETELQSKFPILWLRASRGFGGVWDGQYDYWRLHGALSWRLHHRRWGSTDMMLEGGRVSADVPYAKLFTTLGFGAGWSEVSLNTAFETMQPYEFVSDRMANVYVEHNFNRLSSKNPRFQPQPALIHRMGWGDLSRPELHELGVLNRMNRGYFESGLAINSLLRFNYVNIGYIGFGIKALYRYGPYTLPDWKDNVAVRLTMKFSR